MPHQQSQLYQQVFYLTTCPIPEHAISAVGATPSPATKTGALSVVRSRTARQTITSWMIGGVARIQHQNHNNPYCRHCLTDTAKLPDDVKDDPHLHACCVAGATLVDELQIMLEQAIFIEIRITPKDESREFICDWVPGSGMEDFVVSAHIEAVKPK